MSTSRLNNIQVVTISNNLHETDYRNLFLEIESSMGCNSPNVVVDMSELDYINSMGISFLLKIKKSTENIGGDIAIAVFNNRVISILSATKLFEYFNPKNNLNDAIRYFQS